MKQAEFVAFVQNVIMNFVVDIFAECSFRFRPPSKLHHCIKTKFDVKNLYTITFCSNAKNSACFINFWSDNHVHDLCVNDEYFSFIKILLQQLDYI